MGSKGRSERSLVVEESGAGGQDVRATEPRAVAVSCVRNPETAVGMCLDWQAQATAQIGD